MPAESRLKRGVAETEPRPLGCGRVWQRPHSGRGPDALTTLDRTLAGAALFRTLASEAKSLPVTEKEPVRCYHDYFPWGG